MNRVNLTRTLTPLSMALVLLALAIGTLLSLTPTSFAAEAPQSYTPLESLSTNAIPPVFIYQSIEEKSIDLQATTVPSISNITGASYDESRGEVVIFGVADSSLPPLDFSYIRENLVLALRAYYNPDGLEIPGVSFEGDGNPYWDVVYFGNITYTHFGKVTYESDRLIKIYNIGVDNLTGLPVTSNVPGYMSYPDRMKLLPETTTANVSTRYFFTPTLFIKEIASPHTIVFSPSHQLIDWAYNSVATSTATSIAAQAFVDNFNEYYPEYAAERWTDHGDSTLYEMVQLAKITAIAQWIKNENLDLKLPGFHSAWLNNFPVVSQTAVIQTPGITVSWTQPLSDNSFSVSTIRSGVFSLGSTKYEPPTASDQAIADDIDDEELADQIVRMARPDFSVGCLDDTCSLGGALVLYKMAVADNATENGNFELGPASKAWIQNSVNEMITSGSPLHGMYGLQFPTDHNVDVTIHQTIHIPADAAESGTMVKAGLTYWRAVATTQAAPSNHDTFAVFITDINNNVLATFETLDNTDAGPWQRVSVDLSDYVGQTIKLWFRGTTDGSDITNFFVDDVSLDYFDPIPPAITTASHHVIPPIPVIEAADTDAMTNTVEFAITFDEQMQTSVTPTVKINLLGSSTISYPITPKAGISYTNGYLNSDPTKWYGLFNFTSHTTPGNYGLSVDSAQDLADNVMVTAENVVTVNHSSNSNLEVYMPIIVRNN